MNREIAQLACAVCRHQRKRCPEDCEMAPYFPASTFDEFQNAHKLFGVSCIQKNINSVPPQHKKAAAASIVMEANTRANDPVHGSVGIVRALKAEIEFAENELRATQELIAFYREREQQKKKLENLQGSSSSVPFQNLYKEEDLRMVDDMLNFLPTSPPGAAVGSCSDEDGEIAAFDKGEN